MMSSPARRAELRAQYEAEMVAEEEERARVASLSIWMRIEEAATIDDIKAILHILAERLPEND